MSESNKSYKSNPLPEKTDQWATGYASEPSQPTQDPNSKLKGLAKNIIDRRQTEQFPQNLVRNRRQSDISRYGEGFRTSNKRRQFQDSMVEPENKRFDDLSSQDKRPPLLIPDLPPLPPLQPKPPAPILKPAVLKPALRKIIPEPYRIDDSDSDEPFLGARRKTKKLVQLTTMMTPTCKI